MESNLFVYGTLMKGFPNEMAEFLQNHSSFVGKGEVNGMLYSVTNWQFPYPIAVLKKNHTQKIKGEIFQIHPAKIQAVFEVLDEYEGVGNQFPQPNEYERKLVDIAFSGQTLKCWMYSSLKKEHSLPIIPSGDFRQFLQENEF